MTQYKDLYNILARIGKELHSNPKNNTNYMQHIEELKQYLQNNKGIAVNKELFQLVIRKSMNVQEMKISQEAIHLLLSHCINNGNNIKSKGTEKTLPFQEVIDCLKEAMRKQRCYCVSDECNKLLNYQDKDGNSLLHKAVLAKNIDAIKTLLQHNVNPLAENKDKKIPLTLDGIIPSAKSALVNGMEEQAKRHKESAMANISIAFVAGFFSTIGIGVTMSMVLGDGASLSNAVGIGVSLALLVGGVAALAVYSFSPEYKQAKAIDCALVKDASLEGAKINHVSGNNKEQVV